MRFFGYNETDQNIQNHKYSYLILILILRLIKSEITYENIHKLKTVNISYLGIVKMCFTF